VRLNGIEFPAVRDDVLGCRILFGETSDMFHPMLIFLIASAGKRNSAIAESEEPPLVLGKHEE
jgi:hypothetical protein